MSEKKEQSRTSKISWWLFDKAASKIWQGIFVAGGLAIGELIVLYYRQINWTSLKSRGDLLYYALRFGIYVVLLPLLYFIIFKYTKVVRTLRDENKTLKDEANKPVPPVPKKDVLSNLGFEFPHLELKHLGGDQYEVGLGVACTNTMDASVNLGKIDLKLGRAGNKLEIPLSLTAGVVPTGKAQERVNIKAQNYLPKWSCYVNRDIAMQILSSVNEDSAVQADVRIWVIDEKRYWPDNTNQHDPDIGWKGSIKILDHQVRVEEIRMLKKTIVKASQAIHVFLTSGGVKSLPASSQEAIASIAGMIAALEANADRIKGIPKPSRFMNEDD